MILVVEMAYKNNITNMHDKIYGKHVYIGSMAAKK
jgi:hypothetical protein